MTQEEKAKRYDEAIERARALNNGEVVNIKIGTTTCEYIFPELKESEDERIRKELIDFVKSRLAGFPECGRFIAWLEKQDIFSKKDVDDAYLKGVADTKNEIEKQHEANYQIRKDIVIKPKFHKGDWVACEGLNTAKILSINADRYEVEFINGDKGFPHIDYIDRNFHLWTIQDAKDGDVLSANWREGANFWERIIIFNKYHSKGVKGVISAPYVEGYGNTFKNGKLIPCAKVPYYSTWTDNLYPATKEQRDLLFQKLKEAGYEWDVDNKELKKEEIK